MVACTHCGTPIAEGRCPGCGASAEPAVQAELGHLRYILHDIQRMAAARAISERGAAFLTDRYERRRAELLGTSPAPMAVAAGPPPAPSATTTTALATGDAPVAAPLAPPRVAIDAPVLLLWLGAFLVTVASLIFVGYRWAELSGPVKTLLMAGLTGAFFGVGALTLRRPVLRPAGRTFLVIGAVLTPLTFVAAYNFWLRDAGLGWATLGLLGALSCMALYGALAVRLRGQPYPAAAVLALVAAVGFGLATLNLFERWWMLAAALLGLALTLTHWRWSGPTADLFRPPARWLASGLAVLAGFGVLGMIAIEFERSPWPARVAIDWPPIALTLVGLALHAGLAGQRARSAPLAALAGGLVILATGATAAALGATRGPASLIMVGVTVLGVALAERGPRHWRTGLVAPFGLAALLVPWLTVDERGPFVAATLLAVAGLGGLAWRWWQPGWLYGAAPLLLAGYVSALGWLGGEPSGLRLALALSPLWLLFMAGLIGAGRRLGRAWAGAAYLGFLLTGGLMAVLLGLPDSWQAAGLSSSPPLAVQLLIFAALAWLAVALVGEVWLLAVPVVLLHAALLVLGQLLNIDLRWFPLAGLLLGWALWWTRPGRAIDSRPSWWQRRLGEMQRWLALAVIGWWLVATVLALPMTDAVTWTPLAVTFLINAALAGLAAAVERRRWLAEAASASALLALLVQLGQAQLDDIHWYSLPVAVWLLTLGWLRDRAGQPLAAALLAAGCLALVGPTLTRSLDSDGWRYSLLAGAEGLVLLGAGLRLGRRVLVASGVLTVTLVTLRLLFDSLRSLPNWAILGVAGLVLLTVALLLLLQRERLARLRGGVQAQWRAWH